MQDGHHDESTDCIVRVYSGSQYDLLMIDGEECQFCRNDIEMVQGAGLRLNFDEAGLFSDNNEAG